MDYLENSTFFNHGHWNTYTPNSLSPLENYLEWAKLANTIEEAGTRNTERLQTFSLYW